MLFFLHQCVFHRPPSQVIVLKRQVWTCPIPQSTSERLHSDLRIKSKSFTGVQDLSFSYLFILTFYASFQLPSGPPPHIAPHVPEHPSLSLLGFQQGFSSKTPSPTRRPCVFQNSAQYHLFLRRLLWHSFPTPRGLGKASSSGSLQHLDPLIPALITLHCPGPDLSVSFLPLINNPLGQAQGIVFVFQIPNKIPTFRKDSINVCWIKWTSAGTI